MPNTTIFSSPTETQQQASLSGLRSHTAERAARANASHENVNFPLRVSPNLLRRGGHVGRGVGRIVKLSWDESPRMFRSQFFGAANRPLHAFRPRRQHQFGPQRPQQITAFEAHRFGHGEDDAITLHRGHPCQSHSRVAARRFDDDATGPQGAAPFHIFNHGQSHTVFHAAAGVEIFQFDNEPRFQLQFLFNSLHFEQWRVANKLRQIAIYFAHDVFAVGWRLFLRGVNQY